MGGGAKSGNKTQKGTHSTASVSGRRHVSDITTLAGW